MYALSSEKVGTFGGGMMSQPRYFSGKVFVRTHEVVVVFCLSVLSAASADLLDITIHEKDKDRPYSGVL